MENWFGKRGYPEDKVGKSQMERVKFGVNDAPKNFRCAVCGHIPSQT